jgi:hypothetical protein
MKKECKMFNGKTLEVGEEIRFADLWQVDDGDEEELLDSGCVCVGNNEYGAPVIAGFKIVDKDEENLINTVVKVVELY